jgi:hypothetical protein
MGEGKAKLIEDIPFGMFRLSVMRPPSLFITPKILVHGKAREGCKHVSFQSDSG